MNKEIFAFIKNDNVFVVVCGSECEKLNELNGCEIESDDLFYIMGTDARGELQETSSGKQLIFKSNDVTYFRCPLEDEVLEQFSSNESLGFCLIRSEVLIDEEEAYRMFTGQEIDGVICSFYTELEKQQIFETDKSGNIIGLK